MDRTWDSAAHGISVSAGHLIKALSRFPLGMLLLGLLQVQPLQAQPATAITRTDVIDESSVSQLTLAKPAAEAIKSRLKLSPAELAGRTIRVKKDAVTLTVTAANIDTAITPHSLLVERTGREVQSASRNNATIWQLPVQFSYIRGDGSSFSFRPFIKVMQPLRFNHQERTFKGLLGLGVVDESRPRARERLADPVSFTLTGFESITPNQVTVTHLSQPFKEVELRLINPDDEVSLGVIATLESETDSIKVPAIRPQLKLRISPSQRIEGLGLSTAVVHIAAEDGGIFAGEKIALESTLGRLKDSQVTLDTAGTAQTRIRSSFIGPARVTAQGYPFAEATDTVTFGWPVVLTVVALIAAGLGAWVRRKSGKGSFSVALAFGVVGAILGAIGVNFLSLPVEIPAGEAIIFVLTFFSAYLGPMAFKSVLPSIDDTSA